MGKGANQNLLGNAGTGQQRSTALQNTSNQISNYLIPQLTSEANNPQGYSPQQLAYMNTASQQSLGGSAAGATGEANLTTARTRNAGGYQGAIASSTRSAQRQLSQNALGIQQSQAQLQQAQRQQALSALQSLYGVDLQTAEGYLNSSNSALEGENKSSGLNSLTDQYILGAQKAASQMAAAGGG